jgi:membrane-associated protease RseP (regulator of RpoE activity)
MRYAGLKIAVFAAIFFLVFGLFCGSSRADTLAMKDGREIKGVVVEDYKDRVILSTVDGEVTVMKPDIKELSFDDDESNLIKLAEQAVDRRRYLKAVDYYGWALKLNPDSRLAKDGLIFLQLHLYGKEKAAVEDGLKRRSDIESLGGSISSSGSEAEELEKSGRELARRLGMALEADGNMPYVNAVRRDSPAYDAGIRRSDQLVAIWGRLTGYMSLKEVMDRLLEASSSEIRCTIGRDIDTDVIRSQNPLAGPDDVIGASLGIGLDGLTVTKVKSGGPASSAGIEAGDIIVSIDSNSTRYMSLKKVIETIRKSEGRIKLAIRRNTVIWKRD